MIKKFTRVVLITVIPIGIITGCGTNEKIKKPESKAVQTEKSDYWDYSYGSAGILVSAKAKERQQGHAHMRSGRPGHLRDYGVDYCSAVG